jgi:hypothetical protein
MLTKRSRCWKRRLPYAPKAYEPSAFLPFDMSFLWVPHHDQGLLAQVQETARSAIGVEAFTASCAAGQTMTLEQAVAYALRGSEVDAEQPARAIATSKKSG